MYVESHFLPAKRTREAIDIQLVNNTVYHCYPTPLDINTGPASPSNPCTCTWLD
jgi:hypothetical protein